MDDSERLAAYDAFARGIRAELAEVGARMDVLRTENKVKTATYRQLFAPCGLEPRTWGRARRYDGGHDYSRAR